MGKARTHHHGKDLRLLAGPQSIPRPSMRAVSTIIGLGIVAPSLKSSAGNPNDSGGSEYFVTWPQWVVETLVSRIYAGVFHSRVSRGRVFNFLATFFFKDSLTPERSIPLG